MGGGERVIDQDFVENLGKNIARTADRNLPGASNLADEAAEIMKGAGQSGGIPVAAAFFFACEYAAAAWGSKHDQADNLNEGAQRAADNWREVEARHTVPPNI